MTPDLLAVLQGRRAARATTLLATRLTDGAQLLFDGEARPLPGAAAPVDVPPTLAREADAAIADRRTRSTEIDGVPWFLDLHLPPTRLLVIGAVHIAQSLAPLADAVGLAATVIDPRASFATPARFPGIALRVAWPEDAIAAEAVDRRTAVVALTHDPKIDDPALAAALRSEAFYIGALGSRGSHARRLDRLGALGFDPPALARIRGPVGLPIGAVTPAEIALSILAEIVAVERDAALGRR